MNLTKKPLRTDIFATLRDRIVYLEYPPGRPLSEKDLCREFGVSRTPLREAIRKLEDMNLVTVIPRFGTHVSTIDINEIRCAFEVKIKLEGLAAAAAARRITADKLAELETLLDQAEALLSRGTPDQRSLIDLDARFHEAVYQAAQNQILREFLENLYSRCARLWSSFLGASIDMTEVIGQLRDVYAALKARQAERAAALSEAHVQHFITKLKDQLL